MRILVITYFFPPDRAVGGQRALKVVDALSEAGHDVVVIAAGESAQSGSRRVRRVRPLPSPRDVYRGLRRFRPRTAGASRPGGESVGEDQPEAASDDAKTDPAWWKRWIYSAMWLPDDRQGFVWPAVRLATALPSGAPDVVYTTAPPFSVHLAGLLTKVLTGASWVAEFRDPWTTNPCKSAFVRSRLSDWTEARLESLCLGHADMVVAVSDGIAEDLAAASSHPKLITVRNGIERLATGEAMAASDPFRIVYAGSFYHSRDPFPFLEAIAGVIAERELRPEQLTVLFMGTTDVYKGQSIPAFIAEHGLTGFVQLAGWMERESCLEQLSSADTLLLLAMEQPAQVPNKAYEYLGTRRPILAIADDAGETARMLRRSGGHEIVTANESGPIGEALNRLIDRSGEGVVGDASLLAEWTTENQMASLVRAIGGTCRFTRS